MKREILFRGLKKDGTGWVYGGYFYDNHIGEAYIITNTLDEVKYGSGLCQYVEVIEETVGQFSGYYDETGEKIYDGDALHSTGYYCEVVFIDGGFHTVYNHPEDGETLPFIDIDVNRMRIVGNIHQIVE